MSKIANRIISIPEKVKINLGEEKFIELICLIKGDSELED